MMRSKRKANKGLHTIHLIWVTLFLYWEALITYAVDHLQDQWLSQCVLLRNGRFTANPFSRHKNPHFAFPLSCCLLE